MPTESIWVSSLPRELEIWRYHRMAYLSQCPQIVIIKSAICPYQKLICKYKEFGCKDLKDHENNNKLHLRIAMDTLLAVQTQCRRWTEECSVLRAPVNSTAKQAHRITFKMNNFRKCKEKRKEFHSPSFHTHPEGYKMIISKSKGTVFYSAKVHTYPYVPT